MSEVAVASVKSPATECIQRMTITAWSLVLPVTSITSVIIAPLEWTKSQSAMVKLSTPVVISTTSYQAVVPATQMKERDNTPPSIPPVADAQRKNGPWLFST